MGTRAEFHTVLKEIVDNVYFQPPPTIKMIYPCIVYNLDDILTDKANNLPYNVNKSYSVTLIDRDPDGAILEEVVKLPLCSFSRFYVVDGLNHYSFTIFF